MRLWPDSIFGRTALVLLAGLVVSNLIGIAVYVNDRSTQVDRARSEAVAERIATLTRAVAEASPEERARRMDFMRGPGLRARWTPGDPLVQVSRGSWRAALLRGAIEEQLGDLKVGEIRIGDGSALLALSGQLRGSFEHWRGRDRRTMMGPGMMRPEPPPGLEGGFAEISKAAVAVSIRIPDGSWVDFATFFVPPQPFWKSAQFLSIVVSTLVVMALALWAVWRATQPLAVFARAADRLGRDVNAPDLPETGAGEMRRAAQAFNQMQSRLRAYVTDRTQMVAAISHDLRTPITRMKLRAEFIDDAETQAKTLADLQEMEDMVSATLSFARDDAAEERRVPVDLAGVLRDLCAQASEAGGDAVYQGPAEKELVAGPSGIRRLFSNLIDNALAYGGNARVGLREESGAVVVSVEDHGPGIPEGELDRVFRPFYRLEPSRSRETGGVGLGLAVVRSIARAHGGDVSLRNRPEGGLKAEVRLPV